IAAAQVLGGADRLRRRLDIIAMGRERRPNPLEDDPAIVDYEDTPVVFRHAPFPPTRSSVAIARLTGEISNRAPLPFSELTTTAEPASLSSALPAARPTPRPARSVFVDAVENPGKKIASPAFTLRVPGLSTCISMPRPSSSTLTVGPWSPAWQVTRTTP